MRIYVYDVYADGRRLCVVGNKAAADKRVIEAIENGEAEEMAWRNSRVIASDEQQGPRPDIP